MKTWLQALQRTRDAIVSSMSRLVGRPDSKANAFDGWEEALVRADVPARLAAEICDQARRQRGGSAAGGIRAAVMEALGPNRPYSWSLPAKPGVVLIVGVNGSGKTTTTAKLAYLAGIKGLRPLLAATDTFRAAGAEQLKIWADRVGCDSVVGRMGADAAAVAFDAVRAAMARGADIVFVDTAGRMHTREPLMNELIKVKNAVGKALPGAPHEVWLVVDATIGNNILEQARTFHAAAALTGIIVTKLDGSAKAGCLLAVRREIQLPILFVGLGEEMDDLVPFDPHEYAVALLENTEPQAEPTPGGESGG